MKHDYLIVHESILPSYYALVIQARQLIEQQGMSTSGACKQMGISRSTYYKYKDYVFYPHQASGRRAILGFNLRDEAGVLSHLMAYVASINANIMTIHQETPLHGVAYVTLTLDVKEITSSIDEMMTMMKGLHGVDLVNLIAIE